MEQKTKKRGGKREGAGRPKTTAKRYGFCAPDDVVTILENLDCERTEFILSAIRFIPKLRGNKFAYFISIFLRY